VRIRGKKKIVGKEIIMKKKLSSMLLVLVFLMTQIIPAMQLSTVYAADADGGNCAVHYFYSQLQGDAKSMYQAMENMDKEGILKSGTKDYDLDNVGISQEQIKAYTTGNSRLLKAMGEARDAFQADHPEIFYVDFSYLSMRVTKDSTGTYHAYLGTGRSDNYFIDGITSANVDTAIEEFNTAVDTIVAGAQAVTAKEGQSLAAAQVQYVHDYIINNTSYRMEGVCDPGNDGYVHTAYGCLVKGQCVCEGYSKAMKVILDQLDIPCILVQGIATDENDNPQAHMWNYVQIDNQWYGVDATWDDPVDPTGATDTQGVDGYENDEYLLASELVMNEEHVPSGVMSSVGYEFTYPDLTTEALGFNTIVSDNGLVVKYNANGKYENLDAGEFKVSYNGMGYEEAAKQGYYIVGKFYQLNAETGEYIDGGWGYLLPDVYGGSDMLGDGSKELTLKLVSVSYVEFAVTDVPPGDYKNDTNTTNVNQAAANVTYNGDESLFITRSGQLYNENGNYQAPPYVDTITPATTGRLTLGKTYHVTVTYDEALEQVEGEKISTTLSATGSTGSGLTAVEQSKIENLTWDGDRTFTFDFTPSQYFADNGVYYDIQIEGVVGKYSQKIPNYIRYAVSSGCVAFAYKSQGYDWNVFGQPTLISTGDDLNAEDCQFKGDDPLPTSNLSSLMLVTTSTTDKQKKELSEKLEENYPDQQVLASETYNINLTLCKSQIIKTGQKVRVSVGFPEGYSADSAGVTFKAYHFTKDKETGEINGVEEIDCVVTQYGLILSCDAFSPFAICAVEGEETSTTKTVVVSSEEGGTITGADDTIFSLNEGESKTLTVAAGKDYQIDTIYVDGKEQTLKNKQTATITVSYDNIASSTGIVDVKFVAASVIEKEEERGEEAVSVQPMADYEETEEPEKPETDEEHVTKERYVTVFSNPTTEPNDTDNEIEEEHTHTYGEWTVTKEATVLKKGTKERTCTVCGETETASIAKLPATISVNYKNLVLSVGQSFRGIDVTYGKGDKVVSWKSSNKKVATVNGSGKIVGKKAGTAKITVTLKSGKKATITVEVQKKTVTTTKVTVSEKSVTLKKGKTSQIEAAVTPVTSQQKVTYTSSNKKVATVNSKGKITAKKKGTTIITVQSGKKTTKVKVTVK
jgi:uncharacterized protein YjdB